MYSSLLLFYALLIVDVTVKSYTVPSKVLSLALIVTVLPEADIQGKVLRSGEKVIASV